MIDHFAVLDADDFGVEEEGFFDVMCDGDHGYGQLRDVVPHAREQGVAHGTIDTGEGLVEEEECGFANGEGAGQIHALALATGEIAREAVGE